MASIRLLRSTAGTLNRSAPRDQSNPSSEASWSHQILPSCFMPSCTSRSLCKPSFGTSPRILAGRDELLDEFRTPPAASSALPV
jgi:hypothetical protein